MSSGVGLVQKHFIATPSFMPLTRQSSKKKEYMVYYSDFEKAVTIHIWLRCIATVKQFTVSCKNKLLGPVQTSNFSCTELNVAIKVIP